jgi:hypothetical protein
MTVPPLRISVNCCDCRKVAPIQGPVDAIPGITVFVTVTVTKPVVGGGKGEEAVDIIAVLVALTITGRNWDVDIALVDSAA